MSYRVSYHRYHISNLAHNVESFMRHYKITPETPLPSVASLANSMHTRDEGMLRYVLNCFVGIGLLQRDSERYFRLARPLAMQNVPIPDMFATASPYQVFKLRQRNEPWNLVTRHDWRIRPLQQIVTRMRTVTTAEELVAVERAFHQEISTLTLDPTSVALNQAFAVVEQSDTWRLIRQISLHSSLHSPSAVDAYKAIVTNLRLGQRDAARVTMEEHLKQLGNWYFGGEVSGDLVSDPLRPELLH